MKKDKKWLRDEINNLFEDYMPSKWNDALYACFKLAKQLDEPQKPVVPKWFDEWYKDYNGSFTYTKSKMEKLRILYVALETHKFSAEQEKYLIDNQDDFIRAILDGYEVEKEKLYWVRNIYGNSLIYRSPVDGELKHSHGNEIWAQELDTNRYQFTEKEIKEYDERYWVFAVPVDGVEDEKI